MKSNAENINWQKKAKMLEQHNDSLSASIQRYEQKIEELKHHISVLDKLQESLRIENKQIVDLKNKISSYRKLIQFIIGVENGDVLTSEVK